MKPPVETVRISSRSREILIRVKRKTKLERWNDICRGAICRSLANPSIPQTPAQGWDSAIEIEWKTFAGEHSETYIAALLIRAKRDQIDTKDKAAFANYFRAHLERGIGNLQTTKSLKAYLLPKLD